MAPRLTVAANYAAVRLYGDGGQLVIGIEQRLAHAGQVDVIAVGQHVAAVSSRKGSMPQLMQLER